MGQLAHVGLDRGYTPLCEQTESIPFRIQRMQMVKMCVFSFRSTNIFRNNGRHGKILDGNKSYCMEKLPPE